MNVFCGWLFGLLAQGGSMSLYTECHSAAVTYKTSFVVVTQDLMIFTNPCSMCVIPLWIFRHAGHGIQISASILCLYGQKGWQLFYGKREYYRSVVKLFGQGWWTCLYFDCFEASAGNKTEKYTFCL